MLLPGTIIKYDTDDVVDMSANDLHEFIDMYVHGYLNHLITAGAVMTIIETHMHEIEFGKHLREFYIIRMVGEKGMVCWDILPKDKEYWNIMILVP